MLTSKIFHKANLFLFCIFLLATTLACSDLPATPAVTSQAVMNQPSLTPTPEVLRQMTATPRPSTATTQPTATITASPSATLTLSPAPSPTSIQISNTEVITSQPHPTPTNHLNPDTVTPDTVIPDSIFAEEPVATPFPTPTINPPSPPSRNVRIGLNGGKGLGFHELDYQLIREAKIETLKMMSLTDPAVFAQIKQENPEIEFIVRLYDDRLNLAGHPTPQEFVEKVGPVMQNLQPYVSKFEVGNEPNHVHRYEGWGPTDEDAQSFNTWFSKTYDLLKALHPWAELGFPALGTPDSVHRDRAWLTYNRVAIEKADWLGFHCYWQTNPDGSNTMFDEAHGLCFKYYHEQFPTKPIELTEFDNGNIFYNIPLISAETIAQEHIAYFQELYKYPYLRSASSFIISSNSQAWDYFVWRTEDGGFKPVVKAVATMDRPPLVQ